MSDFTLYNYYRSSASYRIRIALHFKSIPFDYKAIHLLNNGGEQHSTDYRSLNAAGEVPTLIHGSLKLGQSMAILEYLEQINPWPKLIPEDPVKAAKVRQFCEDINSGIQPLQNLKVGQFLTREFGLTKEQVEQWNQHWINKNLEVLSSHITEGSAYVMGSEVTAADVFLVPQIFAARRMGAQLDKHPKLLKVEQSCMQLQAFKDAHPHNQIDTPEEFRGKI